MKINAEGGGTVSKCYKYNRGRNAVWISGIVYFAAGFFFFIFLADNFGVTFTFKADRQSDRQAGRQAAKVGFRICQQSMW